MTDVNTIPVDEASLEDVFFQLPAAVAIMRGPNHHIVRVNERYSKLVGGREVVGLTVAEAFPEIVEQGFLDLLEQVYRTGTPYEGIETPVELVDSATGKQEQLHVNFVYVPLRDATGQIDGVLVHAVDVSPLVRSRRDIEQLAAQLESDRESLATLVDQLPVGVVISASTGQLTLANRVWREFFGVPLDEVDDVAKYAIFEGRDSNGRIYAAHEYPSARSLRGEVVVGEQIAFTRRDGAARVIEINSAPLHAPDGSIDAAVATFFDVTDQQRERSLLESHQNLLELAARGAQLDSILHEATRIVERRSPDYAACSVLLLRGQTLHLGAAPSLPDSYNEAIEGIQIGDGEGSCGTAASTRKVVIAEDIKTDPRWTDFRELASAHGLAACWSVPIISSTGSVLGTFATYYRTPRPPEPEEIELATLAARTAAVAIERDQLESERRVLLDRERAARSQAEARADAAESIEFVADGVCLLDGDNVVRVWNPAAEAIFGVDAASIVGRPIDEHIEGWSQLETLLRDAPSAVATSVPITHRGREVWLSISVADSPAGRVHAFRDVTSDHRVEQLRSDIIATVSHELRTPLAAVYGAAITLRELGLDTANADMMLDMVTTQAERLRTLLDDVLLASRLEANARFSTSSATFDVAETVRTLVDATPDANEEVAVVTHGDTLACADPSRTHQVLANLIDNARKYGGAPIQVRIEEAPNELRVSVVDHGGGIPSSEQERIFQKFYRMDPSHRRGVSGTGLGLYISRELVMRMGGRMRLEPTPGGGATFVFTLPRP